jgi:ubiquinone/menaquinone biosynthesis C-methylase UbiE
MNEKNPSIDTYAMGHTSEETRRLQMRSLVWNPSTRRLFEQAGITIGMKVLDVGSGAGDVALLLADIVGPSGTVVGVEINATILDTARARVRQAGLTNVSFLVRDLESIQLDMEFDAIAGRAVLMYLRDPVAVLRRLASHLRPRGIVAFQELDLQRVTVASANPPSQTYEQLYTWIQEALRCAGVSLRMGLDLFTVFQDCGLPPPEMSCEGHILSGSDLTGYEYTAETVRSLLPLILKFGIATAEEVAIDTLAERLRNEAISQRLVVRGAEMVSAWTRLAPRANL